MLVIGFLIAIYYQLRVRANWYDIRDSFIQSLGDINYAWLFVFVLLVPLNWFLESMKWRVIMSTQYLFSFRKSFLVILSGLSLAVMTPNRIGEYGGRLLHIPPKYNWLSVVATFIGSVAQNIVTLIFGLFGIYYLMAEFPEIMPFDLRPILVFIVVFSVCLVVIVFNTELFRRLFKLNWFIKVLNKVKKPLVLLRNLDRRYFVNVMLISLLRFSVYSIQYIIMLKFFNQDIDILGSFYAIWTIFLIQSGLPLPPFLSVLARGELALIVWGIFEINELTILSITFTIWLINLVLPSMIGLFSIMNTNLLTALGYKYE